MNILLFLNLIVSMIIPSIIGLKGAAPHLPIPCLLGGGGRRSSSSSVALAVLHSRSRLFATAAPDASGNEASIRVTQKRFPIDIEKCRKDIALIRKHLGVSDFKVDVWFCSEAKIRELNSEWRGKSKSTDVLSFPACEFTSPENFADDPTLDVMKHLGDIVIAPAYVQRQCARDEKAFKDGSLEGADDAGVSKEMSTKFTLDERIPLLIVHGMIHLLGYDHETKRQWREMTKREDAIIDACRFR